MRQRNIVSIAAALACCCGVLSAAGKIHLEGSTQSSWPWYLNDGAGYRWDIYANGQVNDGTNDAYDGGMNLQISGSSFSWSKAGRKSKDGREIEVGPWTRGSLRIWRRVYIDPKIGYARWIDIFENTTGAVQNVTLRYYSNMGSSSSMTYTTSGKANLTEKDWGIVTASSSGSSRPAVAHVFASRSSKIKPRFQWTRSSDNIYYHITLKIPAKKTVAMCLFEAQRRPYGEATKFLKSFKVETELKKIPLPLRSIIVNMGGPMLTLGRLELPRNEKHDLVVLRNEGQDELLGTIANERYVLQTFYDKLDLPADRIVGFSVGEDQSVHVGLTDGQVVCGKLLMAALKIKLTTGNDMTLPVSKIQTASYRLSQARPEEIAVATPLIVLRSGERLFYSQEDADLTFHTQYGDVKLAPEHVVGIFLDTPDGGLHRAVFRGGSVLSGLLTAEDFKLRLHLGPQLAVRRHQVQRLVFPGATGTGPGPAEMKLRNDDELYGRIAEKNLTVETRFGKVVVEPKEIAEIIFPESAIGRVQVKLNNGTTISGKFGSQTIHFQIGTGPTLAVFIGHVVSIVNKKDQPAGKAPKPAKPAKPVAPKPVAPKPVAPKPVAPRVIHLKGGAMQVGDLIIADELPAGVAVVGPVEIPAPDGADAPAPVFAEKAAAAKAKALAVKAKGVKRAAEDAARRAAAIANELAVAKQRLASLQTRLALLQRDRMRTRAQLAETKKRLAKAVTPKEAARLTAQSDRLKAALAETEKEEKRLLQVQQALKRAATTQPAKRAPTTRPAKRAGPRAVVGCGLQRVAVLVPPPRALRAGEIADLIIADELVIPAGVVIGEDLKRAATTRPAKRAPK